MNSIIKTHDGKSIAVFQGNIIGHLEVKDGKLMLISQDIEEAPFPVDLDSPKGIKALEQQAILMFERRVDDGLTFHEAQLTENRKTMWIHASDGSTVARFSTAFGIDLHNTVTAQMKGASQCLRCTHEPATKEDWASFRNDTIKYFNFYVEEDYIIFDT